MDPAGSAGQWPNRIGSGTVADPTIHAWFNAADFVSPGPYTFGNSGRNVMIAPGYETWDFGAHKDFRLTEKFGLTFRAEFFNFLNKSNFGYPSTSIGSLIAGRP